MPAKRKETILKGKCNENGARAEDAHIIAREGKPDVTL